MWEYINYGLLAVEIIAIIGLLILNSKSKNNKKTRIIQLCIIFVINFTIFFVSRMEDMIQNNWGDILPNIAKGIGYAISKFGLKLDMDPIAAYVAKYPLYTINYLVGAFMSLSTTVAIAVSLFTRNQENQKRINKLMNKDCDLVLSASKDSLTYLNQTENCGIWLTDEPNKEKIEQLVNDGYSILNKSLSVKTLNSRVFKKDNKYNIVCFKDSGLNCIEVINTMIAFISETKNHNICLHIEVDVKDEESIKEHIIIPSKLASNILLFNKNELLSLDFIENEPITKHLPNNYITDIATIDSKKTINVFVIGYDELNQELIRQYIMNNQLVTTKGEKLSAYVVNYHIFDEEKNMKYNVLKSYLHRVSKLKKQAYFELPDLIGNIEFHDRNLKDDELMDDVLDLAKESAFNYFFISFKNESKNIATAKELKLKVKGDFHIYCKTSSKDFIKPIENVTYYGNYSDVLCHDVIVDDTLSLLAVACNNVYNTKSNAEVLNQWHQLSYISVKSNIYSAANIRLKLNLLKIDYSKENVEELSKEQFDKIYLENCDHKAYLDYFKLNKRNSLIYQEHLRWNAFYLLLGWCPLEKSKVVYTEDKKIFRKDEDYKLHVYITTFEGINKVLKHIQKLYKDNEGVVKSLEDIEVYKYDADTLEISYDVLTKLGYKLHKK